MGNKNSGRRPAPTKLKILRGTLKPSQENTREPMPPRPDASIDAAPPELKGDEVATAEWVRVVPMLRKIGVISDAEKSILVALCQMWSRYLASHHIVRTGGMTIEGEHGPIINPAINISDKALAHCQKMWCELGLTPSSRSKIHALPDANTQPKSKWATLL